MIKAIKTKSRTSNDRAAFLQLSGKWQRQVEKTRANKPIREIAILRQLS